MLVSTGAKCYMVKFHFLQDEATISFLALRFFYDSPPFVSESCLDVFQLVMRMRMRISISRVFAAVYIS